MKKIFGKYTLILLVLIVGLCADFFSKKWAYKHLKGKPLITAVPGFLELGYVENRGMVFGILNKGEKPHGVISIVTWVRVAVFIAVSIYIVMKRRMSFFFIVPMLFIWMGAVGNLIDVFRLRYVVDFIHIHAGKILDWPFLFNVADAYICIGAGMLLLNGFFISEKQTMAAPVQ